MKRKQPMTWGTKAWFACAIGWAVISLLVSEIDPKTSFYSGTVACVCAGLALFWDRIVDELGL